MSSIFVFLYQYFEHRKALLLTIVSSFLALSIFVILKNIELNEDVSKVIPLDANISKVNEAYQNTKFSDNLIFHLYPADTNNVEDADALVHFADSLVDVFKTLDSSKIKDIRYTISEGAITDLYDIFYENLPLFLTEKDYRELDKRLDSTGVAKSLKSVYKTLVSPAGFMMKKNVIRDPLSLAAIPLKGLQDFQIEGNYTLYNNRIMTPNKKHLLFFVTPHTGAGATGANEILLAEIDEKIASVKTHFQSKFEVEYFGSIAVSVANARQIKTDIIYTVGAAMALLMLFIAYFFRRLLSPVLIFIPVLLGVTAGLTSLVLLKDSISAISLGIGAVLLGVAIDFSLHVFAHFRSEGDVIKTLKGIATATIMSSLTTSFAFLCLLYMSSEAMRDLGVFAAVAIFASAIFALLVLPHFLKKSDVLAEDKRNTLVDKFAAYPLHQNTFFKILVIGLSILFFFFYKTVGFEEDMNSMSFMTKELKAADENLQKMSGQALKSSYLIASAPTLEEALSYNEIAIQQLQDLKEKGEIQNFTSVSKFLLSSKAQEAKIARWKAFWTEEKKAKLIADINLQSPQYKFKENSFAPFTELLKKDFKTQPISTFQPLQELLLSEYITEKNGQVALMSIVKLDEAKKDSVYALFQNKEGLTIFDKQFIADQFNKSLQNDFGTLSNWSFLIVFIILLVSFGRIELTLLTIIPLLLGWEWTLGVMALLGLKFNSVNIIICTFIFGMGVDYSIFVTQGMLHEYKYGEKVLPAYKTSILLSSITTVCGMGVMIFAQHPALFSIASLSVIGISSIIIITFTIQPILFNAFIVNRKYKGLPPYTLPSLVSTIVAYTHFVTGCIVLTLLTFVLTITPLKKDTKKYILHRLIRVLSASLIHLMFNVKKVYINRDKANLNKPALIIANHQSFLDIMMMLMLHPKIVIMTNNWVWNSPIFGRVIRFADFYPSDEGAEKGVEHLKSLVAQGYSVVVFPEGTRSPDGKIGRFKKGAFYIAEQLGLDILPVIYHGTGDCIRKKDFLVHGTTVTMSFLERISPNDKSWGEDYTSRTKSISKFFKEEYQKIKENTETADFFEDRLIKNYIYKGPVLEWYTRIKVRLEDKYKPFDKLIPKKAKITDIGCGYGMMAYMLNLLSEEREIEGIDYDEEKIHVANECFLKNDKVNFVAADATTYPISNSDVFLISDMLHYIPTEQQHQLIRRCLDHLNPGGMLIIRDGDKDLKERHGGTEWTEKFSTKIFGFNKTKEGGLTFLSGKDIDMIAQEYGKKVERVDLTAKTSNVIFVII